MSDQSLSWMIINRSASPHQFPVIEGPFVPLSGPGPLPYSENFHKHSAASFKPRNLLIFYYYYYSLLLEGVFLRFDTG